MAEKKKLALFTISMARGGAEMAVYNLLTQLHRDYEIHLVLMKDVFQFELPADVRIHYVARKDYNRVWKILLLPVLALRYRRLLRRHRIGLSLSFLERPNFVSCLAKMFGSGARTYITISTVLSVFCQPTSLDGRISRFLVRWLYPKANLIIPCALYVEHEMRTYFGLSKAAYKTIYNGINTASVYDQASETVEVPKQRFWFVCLASFYEGKNQRLLVDAFKQFTDTGRDAELFLLGRGYQLEDVKSYVNTIGMANRIHIPGFVQNPYAYIRAADSFVFPSNFEGLPTVLLEALACGKPIISTDCLAGPREILAPGTDYTQTLQTGVEEAEHGLLVPVKDVSAMAEAMMRLYDDRELLCAYTAKARLRAEDFSLRHTVSAYRGVLDSADEMLSTS